MSHFITICCVVRETKITISHTTFYRVNSEKRPRMLRINILTVVGTRKQYLVILVCLIYCHIKSIRVIGQFVGSYSIPEMGGNY